MSTTGDRLSLSALRIQRLPTWTAAIAVITVIAMILAPLAPMEAAAAGAFTDDDGSIFEADIEWLASEGITRGCNPPENTLFCPDDPVTRGQMAAFLVRALGYTDNGGGNLFTDDDDSVFEGDIDRLGTAGVTRGCNPPTNDRFCPTDLVTRGQMAAFLVRALNLTDDGGGNSFVDDDGSVFEGDIARLAAAGITKGCNPPVNDEFCPLDPVTRGQMAAFLRRAAPLFTNVEVDPSVDQYLRSLPDWDEFSPPLPPSEVPVGAADETEELVGDAEYVCSTQEYSLTDTPEDIVTFNPDSNILWLGGLLQGKGYLGGIGSLAELPIRQRSPVVLSVDLLTDDTTRTVADPTVATIQQGIGELISIAEAKKLPVASDVYFEQKEMHSVEQAALSLGLSARYLGSSVKTTLDVARTAEEHTVTAYFVEKAFTVSMVLPQTPGAVFSPDFTKRLLDEQVALGRIGPGNLPVYVDSITFGRVMMFTFTADATATEIQATLRAVYNGGSFGATGELSAEQKDLLSRARIEVVTVGGSSTNALALIRTGDLSEYFAETSALSSYRPISYSVRNLGDNSLAKVSDTLSYNVKTCSVKPEVEPSEYTVRVTFDKAHVGNVTDEGGTDNFELNKFFLEVQAYNRTSATDDPGTAIFNPSHTCGWASYSADPSMKEVFCYDVSGTTTVNEHSDWQPTEAKNGLWYVDIPFDNGNTGTGDRLFNSLRLRAGAEDLDTWSGADWTKGWSPLLIGDEMLWDDEGAALFTIYGGDAAGGWDLYVTIEIIDPPDPW